MSQRSVDTSKWNLFAPAGLGGVPVALIIACGPVVGGDANDESSTGSTNPTEPSGSDPTDPTIATTSPTGPTDPTDPTDPTGPECVSSNDCPYGYYCRDGVCEYECYCACGIAPPSELEVRCSPPLDCYDDEDCDKGEVCDYGYCQPDEGCIGVPVIDEMLDIVFSGTPASVVALAFSDVAAAPGAELLVARGAEVELVVDGIGSVVVDAGAQLSAIAAGDVDGDGITDLVTATGGDESMVRVWRGQDGGFVATAFAQPLLGASALAIGDFDGDGLTDVFAHSGDTIVMFPGLNGPLGAALSLVPDGATAFALLDPQQDGTTPVVYAAGSSLWLFADAAEAQNVATSESATVTMIELADFSGDSFVDLVAFGVDPAAMASTVGPLGLAESSITPFAGLFGPTGSGELDGDGYHDLVFGVADSGGIRVRYGDPGAKVDVGPTEPFGCLADYNAGIVVQRLAVGDTTGDGTADLAVSDGTVLRVLRLGV